MGLSGDAPVRFLSAPLRFSSALRANLKGTEKKQTLQKLRAACLQNETAPEKILNRYEKRFEKREERSEKRSETCLNKLAPLRPLENISPALFNK